MIASALLMLTLSLDLCGSRAGCELTLTADPELLASAQDAAAELKLAAKVEPAEPKPAAAKKPTDAKLAYRVSRRDGEVVVTLRSLDRPIEQYGEARAKVQKVPKKEWEPRALKSAIRTAMEQAAIDFRLRARESDLGRRSVGFSLRLDGLTGGALGDARHALECFKAQLELAGPVTEAVEHDGLLEETVEYTPKAEEPRDNLAFYAGRVREWMLGGVRAPCTIVGTALASVKTRVQVDQLNRMVAVSFVQ